MASIPTTDVTYQTTPFVPGAKGLQWRAALDALAQDECVLRVNLTQSRDGELRVRPGQTSTVTGLGNAHSMSRMNLPTSGTFMRYWGGSTSWYRGNTTGTLTSIGTGFSGNPLTLQPYRPALSGDPWMIAADSTKVLQAASTGSAIPLGLPAPGAAATAALAALYTTSIAAFDVSDGTQAASWTMTAGVDRSAIPVASGAPTAADVTGVSGNAVQMTTAPGATVTGYSSIMSIAKTINLSVLQGGAIPATDDDFIHLWLRTDLPARLEEVRIYFVCSAVFTAGVVPGQSTTQNQDAFVKAVRPSDFTGFIEDLESAIDANETARQNSLLTGFVEDPPLPDMVGGTNDPFTPRPDPYVPAGNAGSSSIDTQGTGEMAPGRNTWTEFGAVARPLRRGSFARLGNTANRGWNTITGIVIVVQTRVNLAINVACDDWFLTGGSGLDTSEAAASPYDWRVTNYHLDTGDESNPSPVMAQSAWLEVARAPVTVTPAAAYGSARVRQRFYRRGGTLPDDWYYSGQNSADGGAYTDDETDAAIQAAGTLEIDNDQPISTINASGTTVLAQPTPVIFGLIDERLCALGDPYRPGHLYYSKQGRSGSWPPSNIIEVCPPSEALQMGTTFGGVGIVLSRERGYLISAAGDGTLIAAESDCQVGVCSRWAWVQGPGGIYFVSGDAEQPGLYRTRGQTAEWMSEAIDPIFRGQSVVATPSDTILPIDWTQSTAIRLGLFGELLFLHYKDTGGTTRVLVLNIAIGDWGQYTFAVPPQMSYAEPPQNSEPILWLGASNGVAYQHTGNTDAGTAIACRVTTGYQDQGRPREDKDFGDVIVDADIPTGQTLSLVTRLSNGLVVNSAATAAGTTGRRRYILDPFGTTPQQGLNVQLDLSWTADPALSPSAIYKAGVSTVVLPEQTRLRATEWELAGTFTDKAVKGILVEADTFGVNKTLSIEADGAQLTTINVNHNGRRVSHYGFASQIGRLLRVRPTTNVPSALYDLQWIFDEEPLQLTHWETQLIDHGIHGWQCPYAAEITYRASSAVTLTMLIYNQSGALVNTRTYTLASTGGLKQQVYVPFNADKGVLFQYIFTVGAGAAGFWLYREESRVLILPWGSPDPLWVSPFGSDDLDHVRQMSTAAGQAAAPNTELQAPSGRDPRLG